MKQLLCAALAALALTAMPHDSSASKVRGRVTAGRKPVAGVAVSDGHSIVHTNSRGRYVLQTDKADSIVFITTPSGYVAEAIDPVRPGFWQSLTKPAGRNERHDFRLVEENQDGYSVIFLADCHLANDSTRNDLPRFSSTIMPLVTAQAETASAKGPVYTMNLGDFSHDRYWYDFGFYESQAEQFLVDSAYPTKVYTVSGNHDNDPAVSGHDRNDFDAAWNYRRTWGPDRYSVNIGGDHWIFLDNVVYINDGEPVKKHRNVRGNRNYRCRFTESELEWLRLDLEDVSADTRVFMCTHVPVFHDMSKTERIEQTQLDTLDEIFSKFPRVTLFAGHTHKRLNPSTGKYTRFVQYIMPATSGNMWQHPEGYQCVGGDGSDNGITMLDCTVDVPVPYYITASYGHKLMRVYDMNTVADFYRSDPKCRILRELYPQHADYTTAKYRNMIYVNCWGMSPGAVVEIYENGKALAVEKVMEEDPLHTITYVTPKVKAGKFSETYAKVARNPHLFAAKAAGARSEITVRVKDASGAVVCEETVQRPKPFGPDAR